MNTRAKIGWMGAAGLSVCLFGGCVSVSPPTFEADGLREMESFDGRTRVVFLVNATNPNKEPIPLEQVNYRVLFDGEEVFAGVRSPELTLPGYGSHHFELPAVIGADALHGHGQVQYAIDGLVKYHMPGVFAEVLYDSDIKIPEAPMRLDGTIDLGE